MHCIMCTSGNRAWVVTVCGGRVVALLVVVVVVVVAAVVVG